MDTYIHAYSLAKTAALKFKKPRGMSCKHCVRTCMVTRHSIIIVSPLPVRCAARALPSSLLREETQRNRLCCENGKFVLPKLPTTLSGDRSRGPTSSPSGLLPYLLRASFKYHARRSHLFSTTAVFHCCRVNLRNLTYGIMDARFYHENCATCVLTPRFQQFVQQSPHSFRRHTRFCHCLARAMFFLNEFSANPWRGATNRMSHFTKYSASRARRSRCQLSKHTPPQVTLSAPLSVTILPCYGH